MKKSTSRKPVLAPQLSIGLDLGADQAEACVLDRAGAISERVTLGMSPAEMRSAFAGRPRATIVLEACGQSAWVSRLLEELGQDVLVCNPRRLKLIAASTLKTDKLDAEILGRLARLSQLDPALVRATTVRSRETQIKRSHLALRDQLVQSRTRHISAVRNVLRGDALPVPRCDADAFGKKIQGQELPDDIRALIAPTVVTIAQLTEQIAAMEAKIKSYASKMPEVARFREIGGVGLLCAFTFSVTIEDPTRFEHSRDVAPYLGLTPRLRQSSGTEWRGGCTKQGDDRARRMLVQSALCLFRTKQDSALKQWALGVAQRRGRKKAIVALGRKLAVVMHHLWITEEAYTPFPTKEVSAAAA